ncbi:hypothetical protein [Nocardia pneumoniae]|uniref:hypothetical protein n=1 Tax=Nocardia pneumoniae TaxID=228601 RepID=UPI0002DE08E3|nr:hypothetical protein [Nocardia pneumoniae]
MHVVQFSTGAGSAEVAWRVVEQYGPDQVILLTADTMAEDADNWRFGREVADRLGCQWVRISDGRTPMQVGRDLRCVPNNRLAVCSRVLKRELLRRYMDEHFDPAATIVYLGFDWTEPERHQRSIAPWRPWVIRSPLLDPPYTPKPELLEVFRRRGIEPPRLYRLGFHHANCGGGCVRGGQAQWRLLLTVDRQRYLEWENEENTTRTVLGKDVAILRDRTDGTSKPLPLTVFRQRIEQQPDLFDVDDWGACGCTDTFGSAGEEQ